MHATTQNSVRIGMVCMLMCCVLPGQTHKQLDEGVRSRIISTITLEEFHNIIREIGVESPDTKHIEGVNFFRLKTGEHTALGTVNNTNDTLGLYYILDRSLTVSLINEWNSKNSFSRTYTDDDGKAVIESVLSIKGGVTRANIELFITTFQDSVDRWYRFLINGSGRSGSVGQPLPNVDLRIGVRQKSNGVISDFLHLFEISCLGNECAFTTVTIGQCLLGGWSPTIQRTSTQDGTLRVKVPSPGVLSVAETIDNVEMRYRIEHRGNDVISFTGGWQKYSELLQQYTSTEFVPVGSASFVKVRPPKCEMRLPGLWEP